MIVIPSISDMIACTGQRWQAAIGDPTVLGWVITIAYLVAACLCVVAMMRFGRGRERAFWGLLAVAMAALSVNKELDLHVGMTALGRCIALDQGWYGDRRAVQAAFVLLLISTGAIAFTVGLWAMRRSLLRIAPALLGLIAVLAYAALRAAGFNHVEQLMRLGDLTLQTRRSLELGGIGLIAANAAAVAILCRRGEGLARRSGRP